MIALCMGFAAASLLPMGEPYRMFMVVCSVVIGLLTLAMLGHHADQLLSVKPKKKASEKNAARKKARERTALETEMRTLEDREEKRRNLQESRRSRNLAKEKEQETIRLVQALREAAREKSIEEGARARAKANDYYNNLRESRNQLEEKRQREAEKATLRLAQLKETWAKTASLEEAPSSIGDVENRTFMPQGGCSRKNVLYAARLNGEPIEVDLESLCCVADARGLIAASLGEATAAVSLYQGPDCLDDKVPISEIRGNGNLTVVVDAVTHMLEKKKVAMSLTLRTVKRLQSKLEHLEKSIAINDREYLNTQIASYEHMLLSETHSLREERNIVAEVQKLKRMLPRATEVEQLRLMLQAELKSLDIRSRVEGYCDELLANVAENEKHERRCVFRSELEKAVTSEIGNLSPYAIVYRDDGCDCYLCCPWLYDIDGADMNECSNFSLKSRRELTLRLAPQSDRHTKFRP